MDNFNGQQNNNERIQNYIEQQKEYERQLTQGQFQQNNGPFQYNNDQFQQNKEQFQQNNGQYQQYQQNVGYNLQGIIPDDNAPETPQDKAVADKLCWITIALYVLPKVIYLILAFILGGWNAVMEQVGNYRTIDGVLSSVMGMTYIGVSLIMGVSRLAAFVMLVYIRVKYPKNLFGKILMWIAIVIFAMLIISIGFVLITCVSCARNFPG